MLTTAQINQALSAHGLWRTRLQESIRTGSSAFTLEEIRSDHHCDFGQWLFALPEHIQNEPIWKEVRDVHAQFHGEAARILSLALQGLKEEALQALEGHEKYMQLTGKLIILLTRWSKQVQ